MEIDEYVILVDSLYEVKIYLEMSGYGKAGPKVSFFFVFS